jgi:hypothetical protein
MTEIDFDNIICFKKKNIKKLRYEFDQLKNDIELNKEFYENCLKIEFEKNHKLKNLIKDISKNLSTFILDSENQLIYIQKISIENKSLINQNNRLKIKEKIFYLTIAIAFIFNYIIFLFIKYK